MINRNRVNMKTARLILAIGLIGVALAGLSNIVGAGYFLYLWGACDVAAKLAAWTAFKVWISMILVGIVMYGISFFTLQR